jgi:hypothetical protein
MWQYNDKPVLTIDDMPNHTIGFVYIITHISSGKYYIGKKSVYQTRTLKPLSGMKKKRIVTSESDWQTYYSSNDIIRAEVKKGYADQFSREIIKFCFSKKSLTYFETKEQFLRNVLEDETSYNNNILGKFFYKDALDK